MADITVTYNGSTILTMSADGTKTLKTSGKYCSGNIAVQFSPPAGKINEIINRTVSTYTNDSVTTIGSYAFYSCPSLTTVSFPKCTTIGSFAFYFCSRLTTASFPKCTFINYGAFKNCSSLTTASFPKCTTIGTEAFYGCYSLTTVSFPACTTIVSYAFYACHSLTTVSFPACTTIYDYAFGYCSSLTTARFPKCTTIGSSAFRRCTRLKSLYLTNSSIATLANSNAFSSTPIGGYSTSAGTYGSIYAPASLLASYKAATNWTYFSSRFIGV